MKPPTPSQWAAIRAADRHLLVAAGAPELHLAVPAALFDAQQPAAVLEAAVVDHQPAGVLVGTELAGLAVLVAVGQQVRPAGADGDRVEGGAGSELADRQHLVLCHCIAHIDQ